MMPAYATKYAALAERNGVTLERLAASPRRPFASPQPGLDKISSEYHSPMRATKLYAAHTSLCRQRKDLYETGRAPR